MGGMGSGRRWHISANDTVEDYRSLDIRRLKRDGLLTPGSNFGWKWTRDEETVASINIKVEFNQVILNYRYRSYGEEWQSIEYPVQLTRTECHLGGERPWFICPAKGCYKRIAILYGGEIFACRNCHQLSYSSQRENRGERAARSADRIRKRLGWEPGILNGHEGKPKGMHWKTYDKLVHQHDALESVSLSSLEAYLHHLYT